MSAHSSERGFTLVELLVVISIIAVLSVIGITIYTSVQTSARDTKRREDLKALANAVLQYSAANHSFPPGSWSCANAAGNDWSDSFKTALAPYMVNIPVDPLNCQAQKCTGTTTACGYYFAPNMWTSAAGNPTTGIANFYTYQEHCSGDIGDSARFSYACPHYMKSIDPL